MLHHFRLPNLVYSQRQPENRVCVVLHHFRLPNPVYSQRQPENRLHDGTATVHRQMVGKQRQPENGFV